MLCSIKCVYLQCKICPPTNLKILLDSVNASFRVVWRHTDRGI
nr:MAG TPA: hypothetical protein [Caudoviricetes sp.]